MKKKLIELLGLKPAEGLDEVTDEQVLSAVATLKSAAADAAAANVTEQAINDLMRESCGAFNRDTAKEVLAQRAREAATAR